MTVSECYCLWVHTETHTKPIYAHCGLIDIWTMTEYTYERVKCTLKWKVFSSLNSSSGNAAENAALQRHSPAFHLFKSLILLVSIAPSNWFNVIVIFTCLQRCRVIKVEGGWELGLLQGFTISRLQLSYKTNCWKSRQKTRGEMKY